MARWTASAKWAAGPALDGRRDMPLALRLSEGLGVSACKIGILNKAKLKYFAGREVQLRFVWQVSEKSASLANQDWDSRVLILSIKPSDREISITLPTLT